MPGLIRGVARTAVVAGTATAVSNRVSRRQAGRWAEKDQQAAPPPPQYAAPPEPVAYQPAPAPAPVGAAPMDEDMDSKLLQLRQLGELKTQGILSDAEFEAQKAKILGA